MPLETPQIVVGTIILVASVTYLYSSIEDNVKAPKVGYSWYTSSMSKKTLKNVRNTLLEGHRKFPDGFFKIKLFPFGTATVVINKKLISELRNAPNDVLDPGGGAARHILPEYTMPQDLSASHHHFIPTIRTTLTRNLGLLFGDIVEETKSSFEDNLALNGNEWKSVPAYETIRSIICRITNRVTVGLPHCRDPEFCKNNINYATDVLYTAAKINMFPKFLHPIVGPLLSKPFEHHSRTLDVIGHSIQHRLEMLDKYGSEWVDKPNDYLTWAMEEATGPLARDPIYLASRVLQINFAAINTASIAFTQALYHLAIHPEYLEDLREEAFTIIKQEGSWTKEAMRKSVKGDSFLRESARLDAPEVGLMREAKKTYTFSNGLKITKGNYVGTSLYSVHQDEGVYKDAHEFKPWRFVNIELDKDSARNQQYVFTSPEFLTFGYGKHACPGRFFAASALKVMLCYIVMNYDVQLQNGSKERPANQYIASAVMPDTKAHVMFRRRHE